MVLSFDKSSLRKGTPPLSSSHSRCWKAGRLWGECGPWPCCCEEAGGQEGGPSLEKRPKNSGIRQNIQPKRDLNHFIKWPHYLWWQWQRATSMTVWKSWCQVLIPPTISQLTQALHHPTDQRQREEAEIVGPGRGESCRQKGWPP